MVREAARARGTPGRGSGRATPRRAGAGARREGLGQVEVATRPPPSRADHLVQVDASSKRLQRAARPASSRGTRRPALSCSLGMRCRRRAARERRRRPRTPRPRGRRRSRRPGGGAAIGLGARGVRPVSVAKRASPAPPRAGAPRRSAAVSSIVSSKHRARAPARARSSGRSARSQRDQVRGVLRAGCSAIALDARRLGDHATKAPGTVLMLPSMPSSGSSAARSRRAGRCRQPLRVAPVGLVDLLLHPGPVEGAVGKAVDGEDVEVVRARNSCSSASVAGLEQLRGRLRGRAEGRRRRARRGRPRLDRRQVLLEVARTSAQVSPGWMLVQ